MKISDIPHEDLRDGMRVRSLKDPNKLGTLVNTNKLYRGDPFTEIQGDGDAEPFSGFFWNDCECEIVE